MKKKKVTPLLIEFLSVVFAVLLALGLNSAKENYDQKQKGKALRKAIITECQNNLEKVAANLEQNQKLVHYLDSITKLERDEDVKPYFTYSTEFFDNSAWSLAQNSNLVEELDNDFLLDASGIYESQKFIYDFTRNTFTEVGVLISRQSELNSRDLSRSLLFFTSALNETQINLKESLEEFIATYDIEE